MCPERDPSGAPTYLGLVEENCQVAGGDRVRGDHIPGRAPGHCPQPQGLATLGVPRVAAPHPHGCGPSHTGSFTGVSSPVTLPLAPCPRLAGARGLLVGLVSQVWHVRRARPHSSGPPGLTGVAAGGGSCALGIPSLAGSTSWGSLLMGLNGRPLCATCLLKAAVCPESEADCVGTWVRLCSRVGEVCAISSGDPESRRGVPRPGGPSGE